MRLIACVMLATIASLSQSATPAQAQLNGRDAAIILGIVGVAATVVAANAQPYRRSAQTNTTRSSQNCIPVIDASGFQRGVQCLPNHSLGPSFGAIDNGPVTGRRRDPERFAAGRAPRCWIETRQAGARPSINRQVRVCDIE
jgi:hypothetical protein